METEPKLKIMIFTDTWTPNVNGVVRTLTTTTACLKEKGHEVQVVSPNDFWKIPYCLTKKIYPDINFCWPSLFKLARMIFKFKPDAIHISTEGPIGWSAWFTCLLRGIKFTTTYHTKFPEYIKEYYGIPVCLGYAYERLFHNPSCRTMVASGSLENELIDNGFKHMALWGRGVDTDLFNPNKRSETLFYQKPVALFFGRVSHEKNIEAFLEADWDGLKCVVGDGPQLEQLKKKYPDTQFVGKKVGEELATYVASADITVFPSLTDTFGLTVVESLACGTPVAAYDVTGPKDQLINNETGTLSPIPAPLTQGMIDAKSLSREKCRAAAEEKTWSKCTDQFITNLEGDRCNIEVSSAPESFLGVIVTRIIQFFKKCGSCSVKTCRSCKSFVKNKAQRGNCKNIVVLQEDK